MSVDRVKVEALKVAWREDRAARLLWWRDNWLLGVWELACELGVGMVLGFGLGTALLLYVLQGLA